MAVVKTDGEPRLCQSDEIGEILLCSKPIDAESGSSYYGLSGLTEKVFGAHPIDVSSNNRIESLSYTRTGLLGYLNPVSEL